MAGCKPECVHGLVDVVDSANWDIGSGSLSVTRSGQDSLGRSGKKGNRATNNRVVVYDAQNCLKPPLPS